MLKICYKSMHRFRLYRSSYLQDLKIPKALPWQHQLHNSNQKLRIYTVDDLRIKLCWRFGTMYSFRICKSRNLSDPKILNAWFWYLRMWEIVFIVQKRFSANVFATRTARPLPQSASPVNICMIITTRKTFPEGIAFGRPGNTYL